MTFFCWGGGQKALAVCCTFAKIILCTIFVLSAHIGLENRRSKGEGILHTGRTVRTGGLGTGATKGCGRIRTGTARTRA